MKARQGLRPVPDPICEPRNERRMPLPLIVILVVLCALVLLAAAGYLIDRSEERQERKEKH
jgi:cytochrome c-type biogenesis protein CcmH/NrfG